MPQKNNSSNKNPFTAPLTMKEFRKERQAAVRYRFHPLQEQLQSQQRGARMAQARTAGYYNDYRKQLANLQQANSGVYADAQNAMATYGQGAKANDASLTSQVGSQLASDATLRGGDAPSQAAAAASANTRNSAGAIMQGAIATAGANQKTYLKTQKADSTLGKAAAVSGYDQTLAQIAANKQDLIKQRADFKDQYITSTRDSERQFLLALKEMRNSNKQSALDRAQQTALQNDAQASSASLQNDAQKNANKHPSSSTQHPGHNKNQHQNAHHKDVKAAHIALTSGSLDLNKILQQNSPSKAAGIMFDYLTQKMNVDPQIARSVVDQWIKNHPAHNVANHGGNFVGGGGK